MPSREGNTKGRCVTLHMVSSLDGFIAKKDNSVSWLDSPGSIYEAGVSVSEEEAAAFVKTIDCYVLGSRTYEHALELGWLWRYSGRCLQERLCRAIVLRAYLFFVVIAAGSG